MDRMARYKVEESIEDVIKILDSAPIHRDLIRETENVQLTNRAPVAHLAIERGLKALIVEATGVTPEHEHSLNELYRQIQKCDEESAKYLVGAFEDAVKFFGYNIKAKGYGYLRSLDNYLSKVGTDKNFEALRYWAIEEPPKDNNPIPYILPSLHRELLCALSCLFHPNRNRRETVSERVERTVAHAMIDESHLYYYSINDSYSVNELQKKHSISLYRDWLDEHSTLRDALKEAVNQDFNIRDDEFTAQILRDAWKDLQESNDLAVLYYMSTLTDLPKGSQKRDSNAIPEVRWFDKDQTSGRVETPAGTHLGFIKKHPDGGWGIRPSQDGPVGITDFAKTLADAKAYLVNRLTREVTVTVNEDTRQLLIVRDEDFFPLQAWIPKDSALSDIQAGILGRKPRLKTRRANFGRDGIERKRRLCTSTRRQDRKSRRANGLD